MTGIPPELGARIAGARRILVLTGAGMSAESGIPTFRGNEGAWRHFDPEQLASPEGFARDPKLVWEWYAERRGKVLAARPHAGHQALVQLESNTAGFLLLTQNVDGLHQVAGNQSVAEIHGSIHRSKCTRTGRIYTAAELPIEPPFPLRTPTGDLARPDVVWFGETIRMDAYGRVEEFLAAGFLDLVLIVGTTGLFPYIQRWAMTARQGGAHLVEINPEPSILAQFCDVVLEQPASQALPALVGG